jgi:hypothetical protein
MNPRSLCILAAALVSACATAPPYQNYQGKDASCIAGGKANVIKFFSSGDAHTAVKEIDGNATPGNGPFCTSPGSHRLGVWAAAIDSQQAQDYIDVNLEAGTQYDLRGTLRGLRIIVQLVPVNGGNTQASAEFPLRAYTVGQQGFTPIFIPVKK